MHDVLGTAHLVSRRQRYRREFDCGLPVDGIDELGGGKVKSEALGDVECSLESERNEHEISIGSDRQVIGQHADRDLNRVGRIRAGDGDRGQTPQELWHVARHQLRLDLRITLESGDRFDLPRELAPRRGTRGPTRDGVDRSLIATRRLGPLSMGGSRCDGHHRKRREAAPNRWTARSRARWRYGCHCKHPHSNPRQWENHAISSP